jgi:hypothetical protein
MVATAWCDHSKEPVMADNSELASDLVARINRAWLEGRPAEMTPLLDPQIVLRGPSGARVEGRDALVASYVDFCTHARVEAYSESEVQVDVMGDTAVVAFRFEMVFERGRRFRSSGRDLWVLARVEGQWRAVWRTMTDLSDEPLDPR